MAFTNAVTTSAQSDQDIAVKSCTRTLCFRHMDFFFFYLTMVSGFAEILQIHLLSSDYWYEKNMKIIVLIEASF